jgi:hypothetical protein
LGDPANPYAKAAPADQPDYQWKTIAAGDLVHSRVDFGEVFSRSWQLYTRQVGNGVLFTLMAFGIIVASQVVGMPLAFARAAAGDDLPIAVSLFVAEQLWSCIVQSLFVCLGVNFGVSVARGNTSPLNNVFAVGHCYLKVLAVMILLQVITFGVMLVAALPGGLLFLARDDAIVAIAVVALIVTVVMALILVIVIQMMFYLSYYFVVDRRMAVLESMMTSMQYMRGNKRTVFGVAIVAGIVGSIVALATCCVGYVFVLPYWFVLGAVIYLMATGQPIASGLPTGRNSPYDYKPIIGPNEPTKWSASDR